MAKKKVDEGHEETEQVLAKIESEVSAAYKQAEEEVQDKLDDYLRRFEIKDELKKQAVINGQITQEEYEQWRIGQIAVGKRWESMKDTLAQDYTNAAEISKSIAYGYMPEVYAINHSYGTYQVEKIAGVDTKYILDTSYDKHTFQRMFDDSKTLYYSAGKKVTAAINAGKQKAWDKKRIQSVMTQSLLQGESIGKIATRLSKAVGESDRKAAIRNARTMATGVQNAGRVDSYKRAEDMGIDLMQEWLATLDSRTRHDHRVLDGQRVKVGEKFKVGAAELEYPADPSGPPEQVYNCRCTLVPVLKGFEVDSKDLSLRNTNHMEEETYDEWKESHNITSDPITKQDDIADTMKRIYNNEYRKYSSGLITTERLKRSSGRKEVITPIKFITNKMSDLKIDYNEPKKLLNKLSETDIIKKVGMKDPTEGSCTSAAFAFLANKMGLDVKDFRNDAGTDYFSITENIVRISSFLGVEKEIIKSSNDYTAVKSLLKTTQRGKMYILSTGQHTAIIKKKGLGYQFLDLQQEEEQNGWQKLDENVLRNRFVCRDFNNIDGIPKQETSILIDADSLMKSKDFKNILGYINSKR